MLYVVVGNDIPNDWSFDYEFPENGLLPNELAQKGLDIIDESIDNDISIRTVNPMLIELLDTVAECYLKTSNRYFLNNEEIDPEEDLYIIYNALGYVYKNISSIKIIATFDDVKYDKNVLVSLLTKPDE